MKKILFITGSLNQTSQMHQIAANLTQFDCWFSQVFTDSTFLNYLVDHTSVLNGTALSGQFRRNSEAYLLQHGLQCDYQAKKNIYDLVVYCSDIMIPKRMHSFKTVWVQEGMVDRYTIASRIVKSLKLPPYLCINTSLNGTSNICDIYCTASEGYKNYFTRRGCQSDKLVVTGIPNYDNLQKFANNHFPYKDYVMVATTDMRETYRFENRPAFIKKAVAIANGRTLLFKLHPNENFKRAKKEIYKHAPKGTLVYTTGNTNEMIANCGELITQYSTVAFTGIALGKKVQSWFNINELVSLVPVQNDGISSKNIATICLMYLEHDKTLGKFNPQLALQQHVQTGLRDELLIA